MLLKFKDRRLIKDYIIITLTEKKMLKRGRLKNDEWWENANKNMKYDKVI